MYAFVTRHLGISPLSSSRDEDELSTARQLLRTLVPFLVEKRSTALLASMDDLIAHLWPRLVDAKKADRESFVLLLRDATRLLTPRRIELIDTSETSPERKRPRDSLLALSDLIRLFKSQNPGGTKDTPTSHKLKFYASHVALLPSQLLAAFAAEVGSRARSLEMEGTSLRRATNDDYV